MMCFDGGPSIAQKDLPTIFASKRISEDPEGAETAVEVELPDFQIRAALSSQDPLASCYQYLLLVCGILPAILVIRMCWSCLD